MLCWADLDDTASALPLTRVVHIPQELETLQNAIKAQQYHSNSLNWSICSLYSTAEQTRTFWDFSYLKGTLE